MKNSERLNLEKLAREISKLASTSKTTLVQWQRKLNELYKSEKSIIDREMSIDLKDRITEAYRNLGDVFFDKHDYVKAMFAYARYKDYALRIKFTVARKQYVDVSYNLAASQFQYLQPIRISRTTDMAKIKNNFEFALASLLPVFFHYRTEGSVAHSETDRNAAREELQLTITLANQLLELREEQLGSDYHVEPFTTETAYHFATDDYMSLIVDANTEPYSEASEDESAEDIMDVEADFAISSTSPKPEVSTSPESSSGVNERDTAPEAIPTISEYNRLNLWAPQQPDADKSPASGEENYPLFNLLEP